MSGHHISPIADNPVSNFLDDSILFSQKSQYDPNDAPNLTNPFTPLPGRKEGFQRTYLNENFTPQAFHFDDPQSKENILNMIKFTNHTLASFGFSQLGDLTSGKDEEIQKTLNTVNELVQQRMKDIEFRKDVFERIAKLQHDKSMYMQTIERLKQENMTLSKEVGAVKNQFVKQEKKYREEREKLQSEKDAFSKNLAKHTQKVTQYQHDLRKKEVDVNKAKEQMLKKVNNVSSRHSAELVTSHSSGMFKSKTSAENDLISAVSYNVDTYRNKLLLENQELRNILIDLQKELLSLANDKKEEFIQRRIAEIDRNMQTENVQNYFERYFSNIQFINIKEGKFQMPLEKAGDELIQAFRENMRVFEEFINKILKFNYTPEFFKNVAPDIASIDQEFMKINNFVEMKKTIGDMKPKGGDPNSITQKQKKEHFPSVDFSSNLENRLFGKQAALEKSASYRESPIEKQKDFDASLCQELLNALPEPPEGKEFPWTQDIENKVNKAWNAREKDDGQFDPNKKPVLQEANKWIDRMHNKASFGEK